MIGEKQKLSLYMHTHWDREWYWAFERYRTMLVTAMKLVVRALEDNELPNFHLDGQVCALDDFLELEPSYTDRIKKLNSKNRLSIGPWYVLADQMLVGGESLIRNLEVGMAHARRFGKPMMVGYCPDTFGHSQDLPRILKGFGIENAVVWRGVPEIDGPEFSWKSPDGSEVTTQFLAKGYHQTHFHEAEGSVEEDRIDVIVENLLPWLGLKWDKQNGTIVENAEPSLVYSRQTSGALIPVGGDHQKPPANLANIIKKVEAKLAVLLKQSTVGKQGDNQVGESEQRKQTKITSIELDPIQLQDYLKMVSQAVTKPAIPLRVIEGELRRNDTALAHGAAYMLPGVLSTRLYLKRANRLLEHRLSRISEPLYSMMVLSGQSKYPESELENCWRYMLKNHPHDSMCGCSVDDVHREMMTRFASVDHILDVLDQRVRQDVLMPGVHEWSHDRLKKAKVGPKKGSNPPSTTKLENAGFGRGLMGLADPDVPLAGFGVFNLAADKVSAPVKVSLAVPANYFDNSAAPSSESSDTHEATKDAPPPALHDAASAIRFTEEEIQIAADRYLADITGDASNYQIDFVKFETELFGESCGVPLYKDVNFVESWLWAPDVAGLSFKSTDFQGVELSSQAVSATDSLAPTEPGIGNDQRGNDSNPQGNDGDLQNADGTLQKTTGSAQVSDDKAQEVSVVTVGDSKLSNGIFEVNISSDGIISVAAKNAHGSIENYDLQHKLQDVADAGDSYNFDPIANDVPIVAQFQSCARGKSGPLVGSLLLTYKIALPAKLEEQPGDKTWLPFEGGKDIVPYKRSSQLIEHEIVTKITLKRGEPVLFFETSWVNTASDHRLEILFDTGAPVTTTWSENHFSLVERKVSEHETKLPVAKYTESPLDRFPCQRFFVANGQAFFNFGLPEYGVAGDSVSLTALRAISMLSRRRLLTRGGGAGPYMPVPEGNCIGPNTISYGWAPLTVTGLTPALPSNKTGPASLDDASRANAYRLAERFEGVLWATPITAETKSTMSSSSFISLDNARIRCVALYSNDKGKSVLLRLLNVAMTNQESTLLLADPLASVEKVDLAGQKHSAITTKDGAPLKISFTPNELITLKITPKA
ncbi:MAG: glycoside hydrolase family 38 C-terminal domain-containing protein [Candidatus Melainabacteria bacterium]|nr:glycoside hydrolase family 38 C-terminal domain-containing protein [Candidatus Melainabacteria bacterium]